MSESDTMFNERDRSFTAVQRMLSADPSYDNRIIASTVKMQIRMVQRLRVMKTKFPGTVIVFGVVLREGHIMPPHIFEVGCTWMCWRVWWSPGVNKWPVADPGCGSRTRRRRTSPKRPRLGFRRSATTLYPSVTAPSSPDLNPLGYFIWSYIENITNMTSHNTKVSLIAAIRRVFASLLPALVEKVYSQFRVRIEAVIEAEGGYIE